MLRVATVLAALLLASPVPAPPRPRALVALVAAPATSDALPGSERERGLAAHFAARKEPAAQSAPERLGSRREELRGIWIPTDAPRDWDALMRTIRAHGLNAVFVRVAQGGKAIYPSKLLPQDPWAAEDGNGDELARAITAAHRHGLEFHAWKVCFHLSSAKARPVGTPPREFYDRMAREDRLVRDSKGTQSYWLNPSDPRNQELELRVAREVVENYPVDGYHLDYIRYPDAQPGFDFHFGSVSRGEFEKALGRPVAEWPADVIAGPLKQRYEDWERDNITGLVRQIHAEVQARRPGTRISAAVWRSIHLNRATVKQDWPRWGREGIVDFLVPMVYAANAEDFRATLSRDFSTVCGRVPVAAGVGIWQLGSTQAMLDQLAAARELGTDGFVLFSVNSERIEEQLDALSAGVTRQAAVAAIGPAWFEFDTPAGAVTRRYKPLAVEEGRATTASIRLRTSTGAGDSPIAASVVAEDLAGRPLTEPLPFSFRPGAAQAISLVPSDAPFRLVMRYSVPEGSGTRRVVARGPIIEPLSAREIAELRADELPPVRPSHGISIGVYKNGVGADAVFEVLTRISGVTPVWVHQLRASHLAALDLLVLPQFYDLSDLTPETAATLRAWVERGGRLILTRDAVGLRWHPRLFPEVGTGERIAAGRSLQIQSPLPGFPRGARFDHENADHAQLRVAARTKVLVTEQKTGKPVVAAGRVGKGTVILDGLLPGQGAEAEPDSNSCRLLAALVTYR